MSGYGMAYGTTGFPAPNKHAIPNEEEGAPQSRVLLNAIIDGNAIRSGVSRRSSSSYSKQNNTNVYDRDPSHESNGIIRKNDIVFTLVNSDGTSSNIQAPGDTTPRPAVLSSLTLVPANSCRELLKKIGVVGVANGQAISQRVNPNARHVEEACTTIIQGTAMIGNVVGNIRVNQKIYADYPSLKEVQEGIGYYQNEPNRISLVARGLEDEKQCPEIYESLMEKEIHLFDTKSNEPVDFYDTQSNGFLSSVSNLFEHIKSLGTIDFTDYNTLKDVLKTEQTKNEVVEFMQMFHQNHLDKFNRIIGVSMQNSDGSGYVKVNLRCY